MSLVSIGELCLLWTIMWKAFELAEAVDVEVIGLAMATVSSVLASAVFLGMFLGILRLKGNAFLTPVS